VEEEVEEEEEEGGMTFAGGRRTSCSDKQTLLFSLKVVDTQDKSPTDLVYEHDVEILPLFSSFGLPDGGLSL